MNRALRRPRASPRAATLRYRAAVIAAVAAFAFAPCVVGLGSVAQAAEDPATTTPPDDTAAPFRLPSPLSCDLLLNNPWPGSPSSRRALIAKLQASRAACIESAQFLGLLGALLLEDGAAEQALIWLERSLLLDPGNLGVQADHAMALAALGQPAALSELTQRWQNRTDLPPALRQRLFQPGQSSPFALPVVRLGGEQRPNWGTAAEVSVVTGYENNLSRSSRLTELILTKPSGPEIGMLASRPQNGAASLGFASFQAAYAPAASTVLRSSLSLTGRTASSRRQTDWHQTQWTASASHSWNGLRGQIDASSLWFGGNLDEAFRMQRMGGSLDINVGRCTLMLSADEERRRQSMTSGLDAKSKGNLAGMQCPLDDAKSWHGTFAWRSGHDHPLSPDRPGGTQKLGGAVLRLVGTLPWGTRVETGLRRIRVADSTGYNELLENNAVRRMLLKQLSVDLAHPIAGWNSPRLELLLQAQSAHQTSNLPLFQYRADSVYSGLRVSW